MKMTLNQPKAHITCASCGSSDLWRVAQRSGLVAMLMRYHGRKPYQCRACGWLCYRGATQDDPRLTLRLLSAFVAMR